MQQRWTPQRLPVSDLLAALQRAVGEPHVLFGQDLSAYERDWRGRAQGKALCVVRPGQTAEVAAVVKACVAHRAPIVPQGGNTSLVMGSTPNASGQEVVLSLRRLDTVRQIDPANATLTA